MLSKNTLTTLLTPGCPGIPAQPYQAATPSVLIVSSDGLAAFVEYHYEYTYNPNPKGVSSYNYYAAVPVTTPSLLIGNYIIGQTYYVDEWVTQLWVPATTAHAAIGATPAIPPQVSVSNNIGWNMSTTSIKSLSGDGTAIFGASAGALGTMVGFTASANANPTWGNFTHGILFSHNTMQAYEAGVAVGASLGSYLPTDAIAIRRIQGVVQYIRNGVVLRVSDAASTGAVRLAVMLYSAGDSVL
jgi:hypothetical protein